METAQQCGTIAGMDMENVGLRPVGMLLMLVATLMTANALAQSGDEDDSFLVALEESCQQNILSTLPVNRLDAAGLVSSGIFTQWQSDIIVNYRKESGSILSAIELAALLGWDAQAAEILENYIDFSMSAQRRSKFESYAYSKGRLWNDWQKERREKGYVGLPVASNMRFKGSVNTTYGSIWNYGALVSNSRGEKFSDFCSAFVSYDAGSQSVLSDRSFISDSENYVTNDAGGGKREARNQWKRQKGARLLKLVAGDFTAKFGQGLTVWSAKGWNSSGTASQGGSGIYCKRGSVISGRNTSTEDGLLRGVAASISLLERKALNDYELPEADGSRFSSNKTGIGSIEFTGFVSYRPRDGRIKDGFYTNLLNGGQHNTESLLEAKNAINELTAGARLEFSGVFECKGNSPATASDGGRLSFNGANAWNYKLGVNAVAWFLDRFNASYYGKASVQDYKKYQQFNSSHADFSIDLYLTHKRWIVYSEAAVDAGANMAFIAGISGPLADWNISAHTHFYSKSYIAPYSGAVSASGSASNQRAFALNVQRNFHYRWNFGITAGTVYFPWVRYQFPYPSQWNMINVNLALKLACSNYALQMGIKDICPVKSWMRPLRSAMGEYGRTQLKAGLNAVFVLSQAGANGGRRESTIGFAAAFAKHSDDSDETSAAPEGKTAKEADKGASWHVQCKIKLPVVLSASAGIFHCPDWEGRMYAHGFQLPYSSSSTLLYGNGLHWEGMLKLDSAMWRVLGVKYSSYLNHFQLYAKLSGVNYLKDGLNASLGRKNAYEAMAGVKFAVP